MQTGLGHHVMTNTMTNTTVMQTNSRSSCQFGQPGQQTDTENDGRRKRKNEKSTDVNEEENKRRILVDDPMKPEACEMMQRMLKELADIKVRVTSIQRQ